MKQDHLWYNTARWQNNCQSSYRVWFQRGYRSGLLPISVRRIAVAALFFWEVTTWLVLKIVKISSES
jgi:hypothetical protein